jgi:YD repeat-containing protein
VLTWDAENRLTGATVQGETTTVWYDAQSRRIAQTVAPAGGGTPVTTLFLYVGWNPVAEYQASGSAAPVAAQNLLLP